MLGDIGLYGLGVMGENLAMNIESKGYRVSVCNYQNERVREFAEGRGQGKAFIPCFSEQEFVQSLSVPRIIFVMIKAGAPVDETFERFSALMSPGDIFIDGGNSDFNDTCRRVERAEALGLRYVGSGVSGGELGALLGPSLMPGGSSEAWAHIQPIFTAISAKVGEDNAPCTAWMGKGGAGHLVKTVHNGIEYGDMQLICEVYDLLRKLTNTDAFGLGSVFRGWNSGLLNSYLIEITADILETADTDGTPLVDHISDRAMQKGTGRWASVTSLEENVPLTLITEAVYARVLSSKREERLTAAAAAAPMQQEQKEAGLLIPQVEQALYAAKIISYAQGFSLLQTLSRKRDWGLNLGEIAKIWRGGCIIRSSFLNHIAEAYGRASELPNLMLDGFFRGELARSVPALRQVLAMGVMSGIPLPAMSSALSYYDGYHCQSLPANLLQAQRDYFGAHMFERTDAPRGEFFHYNWTGKGGETLSTVYER